MNLKTVLLFLMFILSAFYAMPQCTTLGQTPSTAFPVCGVDTFIQQTVPQCVNHNVPASNCGSYPDTNPFWYQFTCYISGTLGFLITPNDLNDDYDWELFDITGHSPNDIYTDAALFVVANWCGTYGVTGTSASATVPIECASDPTAGVSTFSKMPTLKQGHIYLLLVSHYTPSQSGYQLTFGGGTGSITDPNIPALKSAAIVCGQPEIVIKLSKQVRCNTLASDGSDFTITPASANIISAVGTNCATGFDMNAVTLTVSNILPNGNYTVSAKVGIDGNTLLDDCNNSVPLGDSAVFLSKDTVSAQFSYQIFYGCKNDSVQFINPGGNGINSWQWAFDNSSSSFQDPLVIDSVFGQKHAQLIVSNGVCSDTSSSNIFLNNTLISNFSAPQTVCPTDKALFLNNSVGNIVSWYWDFGDGTSSNDSVPSPHLYPPSIRDVDYIVKLVVQNNLGCFDTSAKQITKVKSCYITVPSGFTPNGDGVNDYLYPLNAYRSTNLEFRVFNRYGQLVFETKNWTKKWDGTINGKPQDPGTFVWTLQYTDIDSGKRYALKGTTVLIR